MGIYESNIRTLDNVAALSDVDLSDGQKVQTLGYYTPGDGGGNIYEYQLASTDTVDWGFVFDGPGGDNTTATLQANTSTAGTGTGRYVAVDQTVANVLEFGAVGDGVADDTFRVRAAMFAGRDSTALVKVPRTASFYSLANWAEFQISATMVLESDNATLTGPNQTTNFARLTAASGAGLKVDGLSLDTFQTIFICDNNTASTPFLDITIQHCRVSNLGNGLISTGGGVYFDCGALAVHDNVLAGVAQAATGTQYGIKLGLNNYTSASVQRNSLSNVGNLTTTAQVWGIYAEVNTTVLTDHPIVVHGNTLKGVRSNIANVGTEQVTGISVLGGRPTITGNNVSEVEAPGADTNPDGIYCQAIGSVVTGNTVTDVLAEEGAINIKGTTPANGRSGEAVVVSGNSVTYTTLPVPVKAVGINLNVPAGSVVGNTIRGGTIGIVTAEGETLVENNSVLDLGSSDVGGQQCVGIQLDAAIDSAIVSDNYVARVGTATDLTGYGVWVNVTAATGNISIQGNTVDTTTGVASAGIRFNLVLTNDMLRVSDNILDGNANAIVMFGAAATVTDGILRGNMIRGATTAYNESGVTVTNRWFSQNFVDGSWATFNNYLRRKADADNLGTGGTQTIDFDAGSYDNKELILNADATLTLAATRSTDYRLYIKSDSATVRNITWPNTFSGTPPATVSDTTGVAVKMDYDGTTYFVSTETTPLQGCSDEGTITAAPTTVATANKLTYYFDVNTAAGDVDMTGLATVTNASDGAFLVFRNTGENNIFFDQDINGTTVTYSASGIGSTLKVCYSALGAGNHQASS